MSGDDFGFVKLFDFPATTKGVSHSRAWRHATSDTFMNQAKCSKHVGHSAHVTNVKFAHDDSSVISVGGDDTSYVVKSLSISLIFRRIFVWATK